MKLCKKCGVEKNLEDFALDNSKRDGHGYWCKACACAYRKAHYAANREGEIAKALAYYHTDRGKEAYARAREGYLRRHFNEPRNYELMRERGRAYYQGHKDEVCHHMRVYRAINPEKTRARAVFGKRVQRGTIVRQPCEVCGDPKSHGHHDDYSKPFDVVWLCSRHHGERHRKLAEAQLEAIQTRPVAA